ncbi:uncharacterized protein LOC110029043 [Phalaenopsis equestris]|uniref:uncharacterized protein LOC110029043 n=1 Tax=Phalaenopsis equestris TaxID=78828 RepID=UPI0009E3EAFC|nr:uncharacterized protein LOC110029043 [Phalaenopsis equestris]
MEVLPPIPSSPEFHFTTTTSTSPTFSEPFNYHQHYTSTPSSPTHAAATIYSHFSFHRSFNPPEISTADKLFEKGKIRPLLHSQPVAAAQSGERGSPSGGSGGGGGKKWRLKDLLLFRSASEGRATGRGSRDPLRKYTLLSSFSSFSSKRKKKGEEEEEEEDSNSGSFRSTESGSGSVRRGGRPPASAHEIHYTANRAAAGEMRKKTPLPYQREGFFSCLQFNPAIRSITKGFSNFS